MLKINIHTTSIIGTEKVILRTVSAHTYVHVITTNGKKNINLKENSWDIWESSVKKAKKKSCNYIKISDKQANKQRHVKNRVDYYLIQGLLLQCLVVHFSANGFM